MLKLRAERIEEDAVQRALQLVGSEVKTKYAEDSYIMFSREHNKGDDSVLWGCNWCDKEGTKKNFISRPPKWQNLTREEAEKVAKMFDTHLFFSLDYVWDENTKDEDMKRASIDL